MTLIPESKGPFFPFEPSEKKDDLTPLNPTDEKVKKAASFQAPHPTNKTFKASRRSLLSWLVSLFKKLFGKDDIEPSKLPPEITIPAPDSSKEALQFYQLTKRLSKEEKAFIQKKLKLLEKEDAIIKSQFVEFENGTIEFEDWDETAFQALYAVKKGYISKETFAAVLNFRVAFQQYKDLEKIPLFLEDKSPNPRVYDYLKKTGHYYPSLDKNRQTQFLNDQQIDRFFEIMASKPKSSQIFFIGTLEDPHPGSITQEIRRETGLEIFNYMDKKRVIPSFEIWQAILEAAFGEKAVRMNPVIGLSCMEDIESNALFSSRDVAFYFPGIALPSQADGFPVEGIDFTTHDFYHSFIASNVPKNIQQLFNLCYSILGQLKTTDPKKQSLISSLRLKLLDMEHGDFRADSRNNRSDSELFWDVLVYRWHKLDPQNEHSDVIRYLLKELKKLSRHVDWENETGVSAKAHNDLSAIQFWAGLEERFNHYLGFLFPKEKL